MHFIPTFIFSRPYVPCNTVSLLFPQMPLFLMSLLSLFSKPEIVLFTDHDLFRPLVPRALLSRIDFFSLAISQQALVPLVLFLLTLPPRADRRLSCPPLLPAPLFPGLLVPDHFP